MRSRVATVVKVSEERGYTLVASDVVGDVNAPDSALVMVWQGPEVVTRLGKLSSAGQTEYVCVCMCMCILCLCMCMCTCVYLHACVSVRSVFPRLFVLEH
jgi:hypothetical protein